MINPDNVGTEETPEEGDDEYFTDPDLLERYLKYLKGQYHEKKFDIEKHDLHGQ